MKAGVAGWLGRLTICRLAVRRRTEVTVSGNHRTAGELPVGHAEMRIAGELISTEEAGFS